MNQQMILLKAVDGWWEGWRCMAFEEFLQRIDLRTWRSGQFLVGMVLAAARGRMLN